MATRSRTGQDLAAAAGVNKHATALLNALGLVERFSLSEANAKGYFTPRQMAATRSGVTSDQIERYLRANPKLVESVRLIGSGGGRAYRLKA